MMRGIPLNAPQSENDSGKFESFWDINFDNFDNSDSIRHSREKKIQTIHARGSPGQQTKGVPALSKRYCKLVTARAIGKPRISCDIRNCAERCLT